ncbi:MAG: hypothetical protein HYV07_07400 [Deltaproteobacteria bacterium]|nr:hypothetical protein [Deltaproteobacteria bacterium]
MTRSEQKASGRFTIFSVLNVDAARCARLGHPQRAKALAGAAAKIEASKEFLRLKALLAGKPSKEVASVVEGGIPEARWPEVHQLLRLVALATLLVRARPQLKRLECEVVAGRISESLSESLVLTAAGGLRMAVPRWLARAANREQVGDCLALVTERLDDRMVVNAVPAIDLSQDRPHAEFSPFGRAAPVTMLTPSDVRLLSRVPEPLKILVPVTIET